MRPKKAWLKAENAVSSSVQPEKLYGEAGDLETLEACPLKMYVNRKSNSLMNSG